MIDLPELPDGSAIRAIRGRKQIRIRWRGRAGFSLRLCLYAAIIALPLAMTGLAVVKPPGGSEVVLAGIGAWFLIAFGIYRWLGGRSLATLILRGDSLTFVAPAQPVVLDITYFPVTSPYDPEKADRMQWEALRKAHKKRPKRTISRSDITYVESADPEHGRGVVIKTGKEALGFARELGGEDAEWLADVLWRWRAAG